YGGNIIDNGSSGGLFVPLNIEKWELIGDGKSYLKSGGKTFKFHPDTHQSFDQFSIPYNKEISELVKTVAKLFSNNFIGWDIALTKEGPMIIEGNDGPHLIMAQMACDGFKNHPKYKEIFADYL